MARPATPAAQNVEILYAAFDQMADSFLVTDRDAKILYVNPQFELVTGYSRADIAGKHTRILRSGIHAPKVYREIWQTLRDGKHCRFTFTNRKKNGDLYEEATLMTPLLDANGEVAYIVAHGRALEQFPRTDRELMQSTLADLANLDSLTGVPNRRRFQEEVNSSISRGEHGAVLFMDVDDFKAINDSLGHSAGDEFLRGLANCLSDCLRHNDVLARLGGDEFAVLLRGASRAETVVVAQRLLKAVREMRSVSSDQPVSSTISIGGAFFPAHGTSVDELLGHADMAMYRVKRNGRNGLHFYQANQGSKSSSLSRVLWKQKILNALENDCFVLHAQPIIELKTGRLACYELLLRLREPNGTLVHPGKFLPAAEQSGLIHQIDTWVVQQSLTIAHELQLAPHPVNIAFNLSATAVGNADLLELFKREALRLGLDPGRVSIEVTETALISDLPKARAFLNSLKDLGFRIALDDFGAGFSSFSRLKQVPADYLKIDGSFIANITRNQEDRHFVRAIADLASGLGIGAVAEYIQDEETMTILKDLGVMYGQGFYIGRPVPLTRIRETHMAA